MIYFLSFRVPNVVVEWVTPLLRIRNIPGSNLGPETGYLDCGISWFLSVPPGKHRECTSKLGYDRFLPNSGNSSIYRSIVCRYVVLIAEKAP
jgi:hypothetical protein